jgi:phage terminase small subunit
MLLAPMPDLPAKYPRRRRQRVPRAPDHLRKETAEWWRLVVHNYFLEPHHLRLLTLAAEAWDRLTEARERIAADGPYLPDRFGILHSHPAVSVERDCRIAFARLLRELDLDSEPGPSPSRPPQIERR